MVSKIKFWIKWGAIKMANEKLVFNAIGVYGLGWNLDRLEWAVATIQNAAQLAPFLEVFRWYEQVKSFEDIGREAKLLHDKISSYREQMVPEAIKNQLRDAKTRWETLARERLQDLYLVTPECKIDPKLLMRGIEGLLNHKYSSLLERIEMIDLFEACGCILIGSATAAEHIALRAAESLLRRWYEYKSGNKLTRRAWGAVLNRLAREYPENRRPKEIALLGYLKQRRDEVAHPDRISTLTEAETTLMNVCCLITGIAPVLVKLTPSQVSPVTPLTPELEAPPLQIVPAEEREETGNDESVVKT